MANEDDMSGRAAATARETQGAQNARHKALTGDAAPSASEIGAAVAAALERQRNAPAAPEKPLSAVVRASVRCGYEQIKVGDKIVERAKSLEFKAHETADGSVVSVPHGRPVRLKREAFQRYYGEGLVEIAQ